MKHIGLIVCWVLLAEVPSLPVGRQEARATMSGRVLDPQNRVVANAGVVVRSEDTGVDQSTQTNEQGNWSVRFLIPGNYGLRITVQGFKPVELRGIALQTADQKQFDLQL